MKSHNIVILQKKPVSMGKCRIIHNRMNENKQNKQRKKTKLLCVCPPQNKLLKIALYESVAKEI